ASLSGSCAPKATTAPPPPRARSAAGKTTRSKPPTAPSTRRSARNGNSFTKRQRRGISMANEPANRIDIHHHFFTPELLGAFPDTAKRPEVKGWSLESSFEEMDKNGVAH